jgi:hypothetical protein
MGGRLAGILAIPTCSLVMLGLSSLAFAAPLSTASGANPALPPLPVNESSRGPWLWSFLNPWASQLSSRADANDGCRGILGAAKDSAGTGGSIGTSNDSSNAHWYTLLNFSLVLLERISQFSGSTHSTTTSSAPQSGPGSQAALLAKLEILRFKTVAHLAIERNLLNRKDYILSLFRPPRAL